MNSDIDNASLSFVRLNRHRCFYVMLEKVTALKVPVPRIIQHLHCD